MVIVINDFKIPTETRSIKVGKHIRDEEIVEESWRKENKIGNAVIPIDVKNATLLNALQKLGMTNIYNLSPEEKFISVITELSNAKKGKGIFTNNTLDPISTQGRARVAEIINEDPNAKGYPQGLGGRQVLRAYLDLARKTGLSETVAGQEIKTERKKAEASPVAQDVLDLQRHWSGVAWDRNKSQKTTSTNWSRVVTALKLIDMSPDMFLLGNPYKKEWVADKDGKQRFIWIPDPEGKQAITREDWVEYIERLVGHSNKNFKTWADISGKEWNLIEWANAQDPEVLSGNNQFTNYGDKIASERRAGFKKDKGLIEKSFKESLKHYIGANVQAIPAQRWESPEYWLHIGAPDLDYGELHMDSQDIIHMEECLQKPELNFTEIFANLIHPSKDKFLRMKRLQTADYGYKIRKVGTKRFPKGSEVPKTIYERQQKAIAKAEKLAGQPYTKTWMTTKEDWEDAYHYFMYAVEIGWRANEALTCGTVSSTDLLTQEKIKGKKTSAIYMVGDQVMVVKFLIRKTWHLGKKDRFTSEVIILDDKIKKLINDRLAQVNAGLKSKWNTKDTQKKLYENYKIITWYQKAEPHMEESGKYITKITWHQNEVHALIGGDGKYIAVGTMEYQAKDLMTALERIEFDRKKQQRELMDVQHEPNAKLRAIMRNCFAKSIPKKHKLESYWTTNTLHSLRHVFAQAWLTRTDGDFEWVANRGHWGGIGILEKAYGQTTKEKQLQKSMKYAKTSLIQAEQQDTKKVEVKETKDGLGVNDAQYQKLLAMMEQMMGVKYQVTPEYKKAEPEKSEGAGSVDESSKTEDEFDPEDMMRDEVIGKEGNTE